MYNAKMKQRNRKKFQFEATLLSYYPSKYN